MFPSPWFGHWWSGSTTGVTVDSTADTWLCCPSRFAIGTWAVLPLIFTGFPSSGTTGCFRAVLPMPFRKESTAHNHLSVPDLRYNRSSERVYRCAAMGLFISDGVKGFLLFPLCPRSSFPRPSCRSPLPRPGVRLALRIRGLSVDSLCGGLPISSHGYW